MYSFVSGDRCVIPYGKQVTPVVLRWISIKNLSLLYLFCITVTQVEGRYSWFYRSTEGRRLSRELQIVIFRGGMVYPPLSPVTIITQPEGWYLLYRPTEGRRLSWVCCVLVPVRMPVHRASSVPPRWRCLSVAWSFSLRSLRRRSPRSALSGRYIDCSATISHRASPGT